MSSLNCRTYTMCDYNKQNTLQYNPNTQKGSNNYYSTSISSLKLINFLTVSFVKATKTCNRKSYVSRKIYEL